MKRLLPALAILAAGAAGAGALAASLPAAAPPDEPELRTTLRAALAEQRLAQKRSARLENEAARATLAADRAAREAAALAARVQQAEAGIAAAQARLTLAERERAALREKLGREQGPLVRLTAALQQFARRPAALAILRPGSVRDLVYTRAVLASAVPVVEQRTEGLRGQLARSRGLTREAASAARALQAEQASLAARRRELAAIEQRERLASRSRETAAAREAERALALAEEARDIDALIGNLGRVASLRERLAALPGPVLRPANPALAQRAAASPRAAEAGPARAGPPRPYLLPVTGRLVAGFGAQSPSGRTTGITLAPRPGALVVAPASGRIAFAGPYRGYGLIVIVEHAGGWTSLVTGLARLQVHVGETLVGGAPLGAAGPDRPSVTLELRRGGEPVNPLPYAG